MLLLELQEASFTVRGHMDSWAMYSPTLEKATNTFTSQYRLQAKRDQADDSRQQATKNNPSPPLTKRTLTYPSLTSVLDQSKWSLFQEERNAGGSPYRGVTRLNTKHLIPSATLGILSEFTVASDCHSDEEAFGNSRDRMVDCLPPLRTVRALRTCCSS